MSVAVFRNARVFGGWTEECQERTDVIVEGDCIREICPTSAAFSNASVVECQGRTLMPGMIDAHVHVYCTTLDGTPATLHPPTYRARFAAPFLRHSLDCGCTTVRDVGGGDIGLAAAIRHGQLTTYSNAGVPR
jgi:imidazolonepropionase-like amidohydrolase